MENDLRKLEQGIEKRIGGKSVEEVADMFDRMLLRSGYHVCSQDSTAETIVWKDSFGRVQARIPVKLGK